LRLTAQQRCLPIQYRLQAKSNHLNSKIMIEFPNANREKRFTSREKKSSYLQYVTAR
jgi:hypothetical protein